MRKKVRSISQERLALILIVGYTCYDYYEHVSRPNDVFRDDMVNWALFTIMSVTCVILISYFTSQILQKFIPEIVASSLGVALAIFSHAAFLGPLWDQVFWMGDLYFPRKLMPTALFTGFYLIYRLVYYLFYKLVASDSSH